MIFNKCATALLAASVGAGAASAASTFNFTNNLPSAGFENIPEFTLEVDSIGLSVTALNNAGSPTFGNGNPVQVNRNDDGLGVIGNGNTAVNSSESLVFTFDPAVILTKVFFSQVDSGDEFEWSINSGVFTGPVDLAGGPKFKFETNLTSSATEYVFSSTGDKDNKWRIKKLKVEPGPSSGIGTVIPAPAAFAVGLPTLLLTGLRRRRSA